MTLKSMSLLLLLAVSAKSLAAWLVSALKPVPITLPIRLNLQVKDIISVKTLHSRDWPTRWYF